jgi:hypothetical protein
VNLPLPPDIGPQKGVLVAVPLFHVTGTTSFSVHPSRLSFSLIAAYVALDDGHNDWYEDHLDAKMGRRRRSVCAANFSIQQLMLLI